MRSTTVISNLKQHLGQAGRICAFVVCALVMTGTSSAHALSNDQSDVLGSGIFYYNVNYCSTTGVVQSTDLVGSDNLQKSFNYLTTTGSGGVNPGPPLTAVQAAGVLGNLIVEDGSKSLVTDVEQNGTHGTTMTPGIGYGIAQWTDGGRQKGLQDYASAHGLKVDDLAAQLGYLWQELNTTEKGALPPLRATTTVAAATTSFQNIYERPASLTASLTERIADATSVMGLYGGTTVASGGGTTTIDPTTGGSTTNTDSNCPAGTVTPIGSAGTGKFTDGTPSPATASLYVGVNTMLARAKEVNDPNSALFKSVCGRYSDGCYDRCDYLMAEMWGYANSGYATAADHWATMESSGHGHPGDRNPPVGALLFYATGHSAGHIAIYLGNNLILSNDVKGNGGAYIVSASDMETGPWHLTYLGWSDPIFAGSKN